jgi:hypothetical protein
VNSIKLAPKLQAIVDAFVAANDSRVANAVGVHLRAGDQKESCKSIGDPRHYLYYSCYQETAEELIFSVLS